VRLFAAVPVPSQTRAVALPVPPPGLHPVPTRRWHLTLAFYGELDSAEPVQQALAVRLQGLAAPRIGLRGGSALGSAVVLRADLPAPQDRQRLEALAAAAHAAGRAVSAPGVRDSRRFRPHVTVARDRRAGRAAVRAYVAALATVQAPPWTVDEVQLVSSVLGPEPRYTVVARYRLGES
jgi:2'-5' RNA ligase